MSTINGSGSENPQVLEPNTIDLKNMWDKFIKLAKTLSPHNDSNSTTNPAAAAQRTTVQPPSDEDGPNPVPVPAQPRTLENTNGRDSSTTSDNADKAENNPLAEDQLTEGENDNSTETCGQLAENETHPLLPNTPSTSTTRTSAEAEVERKSFLKQLDSCFLPSSTDDPTPTTNEKDDHVIAMKYIYSSLLMKDEDKDLISHPVIVLFINMQWIIYYSKIYRLHIIYYLLHFIACWYYIVQLFGEFDFKIRTHTWYFISIVWIIFVTLVTLVKYVLPLPCSCSSKKPKPSIFFRRFGYFRYFIEDVVIFCLTIFILCQFFLRNPSKVYSKVNLPPQHYRDIMSGILLFSISIRLFRFFGHHFNIYVYYQLTISIFKSYLQIFMWLGFLFFGIISTLYYFYFKPKFNVNLKVEEVEELSNSTDKVKIIIDRGVSVTHFFRLFDKNLSYEGLLDILLILLAILFIAFLMNFFRNVTSNLSTLNIEKVKNDAEFNNFIQIVQYIHCVNTSAEFLDCPCLKYCKSKIQCIFSKFVKWLMSCDWISKFFEIEHCKLNFNLNELKNAQLVFNIDSITIEVNRKCDCGWCRLKKFFHLGGNFQYIKRVQFSSEALEHCKRIIQKQNEPAIEIK